MNKPLACEYALEAIWGQACCFRVERENQKYAVTHIT